MAAISIIPQANTVALPTSGSSQSSVKASPIQVQPKVQSQPQVQAQPQKEKPLTEHDVQNAINSVSLDFAGSNEAIGFSYEKKLGQLYVQIKDNESGEVIREFPSKEFIKHRVAMSEMIGLLLDRKA